MKSVKEWLEQIQNDPANENHPVRPYCEDLLRDRRESQRRLVNQISDVYQEQLEMVRQELAAARQEVSALRALVPMCGRCKRVRDDEDYWNSVEAYVETSDGGICPACQQASEAAPLQEAGQEKARLEKLMGDARHTNNPLLEEHARLSQRFLKQARRLEKISRISDGFQTQLKESQMRLREQNARLHELNAQKDQLLGMVAHDLRNPLSAIAGFSQLLQSRTEARNELIVKGISRSSNYMLALVESLLDLAALESGHLVLNLETVDLRTITAGVVDVNRLLAEGKQIQVTYEAPDSPLQVRVDPTKIVQVMTNLINNAIKFSPADTTIAVVLKHQGQSARVEVTDEGPGIPQDEQAFLFRPFGRTSVNSTGGEQSTGLGLAIARRIVEGHQGQIGCISAEGQGSTFWLSLPLAP